jgi:hypothetical protein
MADTVIRLETIQTRIFMIRGHKVMLSTHLAELYGVETRVLNQAVKRNIERFPVDFMFQLNSSEAEWLVSQNVIPQKKYFGGHLPYAFTEQGVAMLSSVQNSTSEPSRRRRNAVRTGGKTETDCTDHR